MKFKIEFEGDYYEDRKNIYLMAHAIDNALDVCDADNILRDIQKNHEVSDKVYQMVDECRGLLSKITQYIE